MSLHINLKKYLILFLISNLIFVSFAYAFSCILDNSFGSCSAANKYGIANISTPRYYVPQGWNHTSDRDGDGVSCEPKR
jgi:hypothetical protein